MAEERLTCPSCAKTPYILARVKTGQPGVYVNTLAAGADGVGLDIPVPSKVMCPWCNGELVRTNG